MAVYRCQDIQEKNNDYSWDTSEKEGTDGYSFNKIYELAKSKSLINV